MVLVTSLAQPGRLILQSRSEEFEKVRSCDDRTRHRFRTFRALSDLYRCEPHCVATQNIRDLAVSDHQHSVTRFDAQRVQRKDCGVWFPISDATGPYRSREEVCQTFLLQVGFEDFDGAAHVGDEREANVCAFRKVSRGML